MDQKVHFNNIAITGLFLFFYYTFFNIQLTYAANPDIEAEKSEMNEHVQKLPGAGYRIRSTPDFIENELKRAKEFRARQGENTGIFGPEFTFFKKGNDTSGFGIQEKAWPQENEAFNKWNEQMKKKCETITPPCQIEYSPRKSSYEPPYIFVKYPPNESIDWYKVSLDEGVLEVTMSPTTPKQAKERESRIQNHIFDTAKAIDFQPHSIMGGGHLHVDIPTTLDHSALLTRNFMVDLENHPAMFMGGISHAWSNSPVAIETKKSQENFKKGLRTFDETVLKNERSEAVKLTKLADLLTQGRESAYKERDLEKFHLVNINHLRMGKDKKDIYTVEIRGLNPQKSAEFFSLQTRLFEARINYLKKTNSPIPYQNSLRPEDVDQARDTQGRFLDKNKVPKLAERYKQRAVDEFYSYVTEAGLNWKEFKVLLKPGLQNVVPTQIVNLLTSYLNQQFDLFCQDPSKATLLSCQQIKDGKLKEHLDKQRDPCFKAVNLAPREVNEVLTALQVYTKTPNSPKSFKEIGKQYCSMGEKLGVPIDFLNQLLPPKFNSKCD